MQPLFSPGSEPACPLDYIPLRENPRDGGAWWAAVYGVAQSRTRLKRCGSSSRETQRCSVFLQHTLADGGRETETEIQQGIEDETSFK